MVDAQQTAAPRPASTTQLYLRSGLLSAIFFVLFTVYLAVRQGLLDLYIANKGIAGAAVLALCVVLLLGPLARAFTMFDRYLIYRKYLGIFVFWLSLLHGVISFFFLPSRFSLSRFFGVGIVPFFFALSSLLLLSILFAASRRSVMVWMGGKNWFNLQSWGVRCAFLAAIAHVVLLKWSSWTSWYLQPKPQTGVHYWQWPSASLLTAWIVLSVLVVRLADRISVRILRYAFYVLPMLLAAVFSYSFIWGALSYAATR